MKDHKNRGKILLVEKDDDIIGEVYLELLQQSGYEVDSFFQSDGRPDPSVPAKPERDPTEIPTIAEKYQFIILNRESWGTYREGIDIFYKIAEGVLQSGYRGRIVVTTTASLDWLNEYASQHPAVHTDQRVKWLEKPFRIAALEALLDNFMTKTL